MCERGVVFFLNSLLYCSYSHSSKCVVAEQSFRDYFVSLRAEYGEFLILRCFYNIQLDVISDLPLQV
jgi:hypothetical protein